MAEPEEILQLFDTCWFEHIILSPKQFPLSAKSIPISKSNPIPKINEEQKLQLTRSLSDHFSEKNSIFPNSQRGEIETNKKMVKEKRRKQGRNRGKSLSELEIEELKGFSDLGFVFSEEDRDSSLVNVIPGLQKQGMIMREIENRISRPYLSESWEFFEKINKYNDCNYNSLLVNWKFPDIGSEIDMKDHLRVWAHTVASAVR